MLKLFLTFSRIGLFTIGGGYAMIPLIRRTVVEDHQWIDDDELMDLIAVAQSCPGVFAINISIFIGYKLRGISGALSAAIGTALPSFVIILGIAIFFQQFRHNPYVEKAFWGIRPAVVALIATPVFKMAQTAHITRRNIWIPIISALLIWLVGISPVYIILIAGIAGYTYGQLIK